MTRLRLILRENEADTATRERTVRTILSPELAQISREIAEERAVDERRNAAARAEEEARRREQARPPRLPYGYD